MDTQAVEKRCGDGNACGAMQTDPSGKTGSVHLQSDELLCFPLIFSLFQHFIETCNFLMNKTFSMNTEESSGYKRLLL